MRYMALIYGSETEAQEMGSPDRNEMYAAYGAFTEMVVASGALLAGEPLHPTSTATTVRVRDGEVLATDGPFAETKEQLGGFYMLECKDLDEAIALAAQIPGARMGSVEVRPVMEMG